MQRLKVVGLALAAVFAFSAVAVASASAHEFEASKEGELNGKAVAGNVHKFKTKAGTVECKVANVVGANSKVVAPLKKETQEVEVEYKECTAFGAKATVTNAKYLFNANEKVTVKNTVKVEAAGCTVTVEPVAANENLGTVSYANLAGGKLEVKAKVEKVTYKTSAFCLGGAGTFADGLYEGNEEVELVGGTLKWV